MLLYVIIISKRAENELMPKKSRSRKASGTESKVIRINFLHIVEWEQIREFENISN